MKNYYRIMLGRKSVHAEEGFANNIIGVDFEIDEDLTGKLPDEWREFNKMYIPVFMKKHPDKSKIAAGLAGGFLWTVAKGIQKGDIVLCPDGGGQYWVGEVKGDYSYKPGRGLPHRRSVTWLPTTINRADMSEDLRNSTGSIGTVSTITRHHDEIERLIGGVSAPTLVATDETVEDPIAFAMEKHLEEFLVKNWAHTEIGKGYDIYEEEGECVGQQYPTDTGPIDILAISKDKKSLMVVELKKGRANDVVVGQTLRYMGFVLEELAEEGQRVKGVIIAQEEDVRIKRALSVVQNIEIYRYKVDFKLVKV